MSLLFFANCFSSLHLTTRSTWTRSSVSTYLPHTRCTRSVTATTTTSEPVFSQEWSTLCTEFPKVQRAHPMAMVRVSSQLGLLPPIVSKLQFHFRGKWGFQECQCHRFHTVELEDLLQLSSQLRHVHQLHNNYRAAARRERVQARHVHGEGQVTRGLSRVAARRNGQVSRGREIERESHENTLRVKQLLLLSCNQCFRARWLSDSRYCRLWRHNYFGKVSHQKTASQRVERKVPASRPEIRSAPRCSNCKHS